MNVFRVVTLLLGVRYKDSTPPPKTYRVVSLSILYSNENNNNEINFYSLFSFGSRFVGIRLLLEGTWGVAVHELRTEPRNNGMYVWECTSVSEDPAGSSWNCRPRTNTEPVITNTRHDIYCESIYHPGTWTLDNHDPNEFLWRYTLFQSGIF
jgi:hypothetical protein